MPVIPAQRSTTRVVLIGLCIVLCLLDTFAFVRRSAEDRRTACKTTASLARIHRFSGAEVGNAGLLDVELLHQYAADFGAYAKHQRPDRIWGLEKPRYHSLPLITGDGFRMLADFVFESAEDLSDRGCRAINSNTHMVNNAVIVVYVDVHIHSRFFESCFDKVNTPIVLITHNGDPAVPHPQVIHYLESPKLIHWFGQNCDSNHSKLTCIPIGLENQYLGPGFSKGSHGTLPELLLGLMLTLSMHNPAKAAVGKKLEHTWAMFDRGTHGAERDPLWNLLSNTISHDRVTWIERGGNRMPVNEYWRHLTTMAAMICPRGNGLDTHRAWESLYLGRVAIVKHSSLDEQWSNLPVLLVHDWNQLQNESIIVSAVADFTAQASSVVCKLQIPRDCLPTIFQGFDLSDPSSCSLESYVAPAACINTNKLFMPYWLCRIGRAAGRTQDFCGGQAILRILQR